MYIFYQIGYNLLMFCFVLKFLFSINLSECNELIRVESLVASHRANHNFPLNFTKRDLKFIGEIFTKIQKSVNIFLVISFLTRISSFDYHITIVELIKEVISQIFLTDFFIFLIPFLHYQFNIWQSS